MGVTRNVITLCTLVFSLSISEVRAKGAKKSKDGGGGDDAAASCENIFLGSYGMDTNGIDKEDYVAWDKLQATTNASSPIMFDAFMTKYCTPISAEGFFPDGCQAAGGDDDRRRLASASHPLVAPLRRVARGMLPQSTWSSNLRRADDGGSTDLLQMCSTCDPEDDYSTCTSLEGSWSCNMSDVAGFTTQLRKIHKMESDDCWTPQPKCEGAPIGAQSCTFAKLGAGQYATGMKVTVEGDRCEACSLPPGTDGGDGEACPRWYDVHSCKVEWTTSEAAPSKYTAFSMTITVNHAAVGTAPSMVLLTALALFSSFFSAR